MYIESLSNEKCIFIILYQFFSLSSLLICILFHFSPATIVRWKGFVFAGNITWLMFCEGNGYVLAVDLWSISTVWSAAYVLCIGSFYPIWLVCTAAAVSFLLESWFLPFKDAASFYFCLFGNQAANLSSGTRILTCPGCSQIWAVGPLELVKIWAPSHLPTSLPPLYSSPQLLHQGPSDWGWHSSCSVVWNITGLDPARTQTNGHIGGGVLLASQVVSLPWICLIGRRWWKSKKRNGEL